MVIMSDFTYCIIYLGVVSLAFFFVGRLISKKKLNYNEFPYRPFAFERDGDIYNKLAIRKWQNELPDMSKIFKSLIPHKKMPSKMCSQSIELMIQETCVAELTHMLLCVMGFGCVFIWKSVGGFVLFILYALGNVPFIMIQRFNRPKQLILLERLLAREAAIESLNSDNGDTDSSDNDLQHTAKA